MKGRNAETWDVRERRFNQQNWRDREPTRWNWVRGIEWRRMVVNAKRYLEPRT